MKAKKKVIISIVSVIMLVIALIGGTFTYAYFTDSVETTNVIATGSIKIEQHEVDRTGADLNLNNVTLMPAILQPATESKNINGTAYDFATHKNIVDKVVYLKNVGKNSAYIRTLIAVPKINGKVLINLVKNETGITWETIGDITVDGVVNTLYVATYTNALESGAVSSASLLQVYLDPTTMSADVDGLANVKIKVISQAIQSAGFDKLDGVTDRADNALNAGFGDITTTNNPFVA